MTTMKTLALAALLAATPALAAAPPVVVTQAWIRALPGKLPAGGYFTLRNTGARTLTLSGAASPACGMLMLHKSDTAGGMSSMSDVAAVDIAPGATLSFAPGGYHLMCMDPGPAIKPGGQVTVTLKFSDGSAVPARFTVRGANGR